MSNSNHVMMHALSYNVKVFNMKLHHIVIRVKSAKISDRLEIINVCLNTLSQYSIPKQKHYNLLSIL